MANVKALLIEALNTLDFSADILPFLQTKIPAPPSLPADTDEADLLVGQLSQYLTNIIASFEGFTPIDLLLHAGQKNATLQGILLSGLEAAKDAHPHNYRIVSPVGGITYEDAVIPIIIEITEGISEFNGATVKVDDKPPRALQVLDVPLQWGIEEEFASGVHTAEITAVFNPDFWSVKTVSFTVDIYQPPEP